MLGKYQTIRSLMNQMSMTRRHFSVSLASVSQADLLASTDCNWVGQYVRSVIVADDVTHAAYVDEYFRKQFRKMSARDAYAVLEQLGNQTDRQVAKCLDGSFWTWETLEEAVKGNTD